MEEEKKTNAKPTQHFDFQDLVPSKEKRSHKEVHDFLEGSLPHFSNGQMFVNAGKFLALLVNVAFIVVNWIQKDKRHKDEILKLSLQELSIAFEEVQKKKKYVH
ncbi:hypothetical protein RFI_39730 [Reticulomyxa filosa]|uniref:Uncharacterized protein n=1 Tax=Reticulomyxa filosa TaxID=46433 RepID=X6L9I5_RETFI|nr:hypothetical protein RFI_39730 [Reticulomyxa filosa]|eukprot:ETN97796.1 hypothetical protein RFI_39730 [Reticulomyxa filosa]